MTDDEKAKMFDQARRMVMESSSTPPPNVWHPEFGWIMKDGKPGPGAEAFVAANPDLFKEEK